VIDFVNIFALGLVVGFFGAGFLWLVGFGYSTVKRALEMAPQD